MKQNDHKKQSGFTIIELVVVVAIMSLMAVVVVIDFNRQRVNRNIVLAKNETVTNLRKVQGYMLSSKNIVGDNVESEVPAKYYIIEIHKNDNFFTINAVDSLYRYYPAIETVALPTGVTFQTLASPGNLTIQADETLDLEGGGEIDASAGNLLEDIDNDDTQINTNTGGGNDEDGEEYINEGDCNPIIDRLCQPNGYDGSGIIQPNNSISYECMQIIFSAPFATMYARGVSNASCGPQVVGVLQNPVTLSQISQGIKYLVFEGVPGASGSKYIRLSPITGQITAF